MKIENRRALVGRHVGALLDRGDLSTLNHDILIVDCRGSRAVNDSNVCEDNLAGVDAHELLHCLREFRTLGVEGDRSQQQQYERPATESAMT